MFLWLGVNEKYLTGSKNIINIIKTNLYKHKFLKANPDYFTPERNNNILWCSTVLGKTLSMVKAVKKILKDFPRAILVSNIEIKGVDNKQFPFNDLEDLSNFNNSIYGVVFVIDEIQNYLNSLQSKDIDLSVITELTQQRKQRHIILATSQVYQRMAKPLREQVKNVIICSCLFGCLQSNTLIDGSKCTDLENR